MRQTVLAAVLAFSPVPAFAQPPERVIPRVEFGVGMGGAVHPHGDGASAAHGRIGVGITPRFGVETVVYVVDSRFVGNSLNLSYSVQGRYALSSTTDRLAMSLTFGGSGTWKRYRTQESRFRAPNGVEYVSPPRTFVSAMPPIAPTVGVAIHYAVTRRIAVRLDAQAVFCPFFDAAGPLVSASVVIPIPSRRSAQLIG